MLRVGEAMLDGELEYRKKNHDRAFERLRLAVSRDDALNYTEPWAWMHPPRHALGALLAESKGTGAEHRQGGQSEKDVVPTRTAESGHAPSSEGR